MYFKTLRVQLIFVITTILLFTACGRQNNTKTVSATDSIANIQSIKEASALIEKDPQNAELYYQRSVSYFNLKYLDRALTDINEAIRLNDQFPLYPFQKGKICYAMNKTLDAEAAYKSAIALKPDYEAAMMQLAELYYIVKKHTESINLLNSVLALKQENANALFFKGMNYKETGDTAKALASFQRALEADPDDYNSTMQCAQLYTALGNKYALDYLNSAIRMQKKNPEGYFARAYYFQKTGQFQKALFDYRKVIDLDPANDLAYYNVGCINYDVKQYKEAMRAFNICIQMNNGKTEAYYMRGLIHELKGEKEEAKLNYSYALQINPAYALAKIRLDQVK